MSDHDEPEQTLTPEQDAQVRRLLADSRHADPMPGDVVARLDRVLAGLADEPARAATVVRLADRRRKATRLLVAAAAVVAVGFGGSQVLDGLGGADMEASSSADEDSAPESAEDPANGATADDAPGGESEPQSTPSDRARLAKVRVQAFADDAAALRDGRGVYALDGQNGVEVDDDLAAAVCPTGSWGAGRYVAVRYAGDPGWIVFRRPQGDTQVADLFLCGSELARRSLTLPYP